MGYTIRIGDKEWGENEFRELARIAKDYHERAIKRTKKDGSLDIDAADYIVELGRLHGP